MLTRKLLSILFLLVFGLTLIAQSPEELFKAGNDAYDQQQYDSSLIIYESILDQGMISVELYKNMGTAAYKLDRIPEAVYYFEKGLKLNPGNDDLEHNLKLANEKTIDKSPENTSAGISGWLSYSIGGNADFWAKMAVLSAILGGVFFLIYFFMASKSIKKLGRVTGISFWVLAFVFVSFAFLQHHISTSKDYGILFEPSIEVRNDPSEAASIAFVLHEGSKLRILDANEGWYKVSFGKEKVGWLPKESIKII